MVILAGDSWTSENHPFPKTTMSVNVLADLPYPDTPGAGDSAASGASPTGKQDGNSTGGASGGGSGRMNPYGSVLCPPSFKNYLNQAARSDSARSGGSGGTATINMANLQLKTSLVDLSPTPVSGSAANAAVSVNDAPNLHSAADFDHAHATSSANVPSSAPVGQQVQFQPARVGSGSSSGGENIWHMSAAHFPTVSSHPNVIGAGAGPPLAKGGASGPMSAPTNSGGGRSIEDRMAGNSFGNSLGRSNSYSAHDGSGTGPAGQFFQYLLP